MMIGAIHGAFHPIAALFASNDAAIMLFADWTCPESVDSGDQASCWFRSMDFISKEAGVVKPRRE
jgi:hypothetical protein